MKINGNLVFNSDASGEIQNVYIERVNSLPAFSATEKGRIVFRTSNSLFYFNDGTAWVTIATGGSATAIQGEVDALEAAIGAVVNSDGTFNGAAFTGHGVIATAASITEALTALADAQSGHDQLSELGDVAIATPTNGQFLRYNTTTSKWENHTLVLADVTDVTASAAEVNILDGATLTTAELNYVTGVTSGIQGQIDGKQDADPTLDALAAFNTNGIVVQTAADTFAGRSLVAPAAGITITNPDGVAGNMTFALANDLAGLEGLATNGYAVRTGDGTWVTRDIGGASGRIVVTDGDGVASNTDIDLAQVVDSGAGTFKKITVDSYGRVTGTTAVVAADIDALVGATYVDVAGDTMTGNLVMSGGATVTGIPTPVNGGDAANKAYVDSAVQGLTWKNAVHVLADSNVDIASAPASIDNHTLNSGDRVLLTNQTTDTEDGIYVFNGAGSAMTRPVDADVFGELNGAAVFVQAGDTYHDTGWTQTANLTSFAGQTWQQFSGSSLYVWGDGLSNTGNTVNINFGAGIAVNPSDEVGIDLWAATGGGLMLTTDGSTSGATSTGAKLHLKLKSSGGLTQDADGLYVPAGGIALAMMEHSSFSLNADSGTGTASLGDTISIDGDAVQGITTSVTGSTFTVSASDASTSAKGVASFAAADFDVAAGVVTIKAAGVDNAQLANSSFGVTGDTGSDSVDLGGSLAVVGGAGGEVSTDVTAGQVEISVRDATASLKGVASFDSADFTVTAGVVTANARALDDLSDVAVTSASAGDTLIHNGTEFVNRKTYFLYDGASATSHTVTHGLGQKYCNVTVVDSTDEVIIPQSITFNSATQLTVTFTSAIACRVVVMCVNAA